MSKQFFRRRLLLQQSAECDLVAIGAFSAKKHTEWKKMS